MPETSSIRREVEVVLDARRQEADDAALATRLADKTVAGALWRVRCTCSAACRAIASLACKLSASAHSSRCCCCCCACFLVPNAGRVTCLTDNGHQRDEPACSKEKVSACSQEKVSACSQEKVSH